MKRLVALLVGCSAPVESPALAPPAPEVTVVASVTAEAIPSIPSAQEIDWGNREYHLTQGLWEMSGTLKAGRGAFYIQYHDGGSTPDVAMHMDAPVFADVDSDGRQEAIIHIVADEKRNGASWYAIFRVRGGEVTLAGGILSDDAELRVTAVGLQLVAGRCTEDVRIAPRFEVDRQVCARACKNECPAASTVAADVIQICSQGGVFVGSASTPDERSFRSKIGGRGRPGVSVIIDVDAKTNAPRVADRLAAWLLRAGIKEVATSIRVGAGCACCD